MKNDVTIMRVIISLITHLSHLLFSSCLVPFTLILNPNCLSLSLSPHLPHISPLFPTMPQYCNSPSFEYCTDIIMYYLYRLHTQYIHILLPFYDSISHTHTCTWNKILMLRYYTYIQTFHFVDPRYNTYYIHNIIVLSELCISC